MSTDTVTDAIRRAAKKVGGLAALGVAAGISADKAKAVVWAWTNRGVVPTEYCPLIERATAGAVTCEELRPDVSWVRVKDRAWPHSGGRPCIDVVAAIP